jgi:hypothetical protein
MQRKLASPFARLAITVVVTAAVVCAGAAARAQTSRPPIVLVLDPCAAVDANEVRRLVPIEMGAPLAPAPGEEASGARVDTTRVFVGCVVGSPQLVRLEVRDPESGRRVDRVITLVGDSKTDQARLVAIVAVELVAASRSELKEAAAAAPAAALTPEARPLVITATPTPAPETSRSRWRALALGSLRHFAGLPRLLPGAGLAVAGTWPHGFGLAVDAFAEGAVQPSALGDVDAFVASLGVQGLWRLERGRLALEMALGARGGLARLAGQSAGAGSSGIVLHQVSDPWAGPLVAARGQALLGRRVVLSLGGESGYVTSAVVGHVEGHPDVAVSGRWWNILLGVGYAL